MTVRRASAATRHWSNLRFQVGSYDLRWHRGGLALLLVGQVLACLGPGIGWLPLLLGTTASCCGLGLLLGHRHFGALGAMRRLQRDLPWLVPEPVVVHDLEGEAGFAEACARHGFHTAVLDGRTLTDWRSLADALQVAFAPMRFPDDAPAKCRELLLRAMGSERRRTVLVVRGALATHPTLLAQFADGFRALAMTSPTGLRLVLDLPAAPEGSDAPRDVVLRRLDDVPAPDRRDLHPARGGGWWVPKAGELADG